MEDGLAQRERFSGAVEERKRVSGWGRSRKGFGRGGGGRERQKCIREWLLIVYHIEVSHGGRFVATHNKHLPRFSIYLAYISVVCIVLIIIARRAKRKSDPVSTARHSTARTRSLIKRYHATEGERMHACPE